MKLPRVVLLHYAPILAGFLVGLVTLLVCMGGAWAAPVKQTSQETPTPPAPLTDQDCKDCHLDIANTWTKSPHAQAFDNDAFQERWSGLGNPSECLLCHTTNYQTTENTYAAEGVSCESCHGKVAAGHPPAVVPIRADTEYCGTCHTTTLHEWRLTGHAAAGVGCTACHNPHNQQALFETPDELCLNCHKEDLGDHLDDLHLQKGVGCVDCHALVIPPDPVPEDGIVPTGHTFTITPATCVACHTDTLHAGFTLPGYENGASASLDVTGTTTTTLGTEILPPAGEPGGLSPEQRIQALETSLASRQLSTLFQGGIIGLVLGSLTAWFVSRNTRRALVVVDSGPVQTEEP